MISAWILVPVTLALIYTSAGIYDRFRRACYSSTGAYLTLAGAGLLPAGSTILIGATLQ